MDTISDIFVSKTTEIQNNLLDLMSNMIEYEDSIRSGQQMDIKVMVNKTVFDAIKDFLPKIDKNIRQLSLIIDKNIDENERLTHELIQSRRRESIFGQQLKELRNLYHNLKDEMEWKEICDQVLESDIDQNMDQKLAINKTNDYLKTCLALISNSGQNQRTIQSFMENQEIFREFMSTIRTIFEEQIKVLANNCIEIKTSFDTNLIETICGICVNVFQCNDYSGEDIPQWIDCLTGLQILDKRFSKISINTLHFISFAPNGTEELQKKEGIICLLAKCLISSELKHEFKLKTNAVKVIRRMIDCSKDTQIGLRLFNEFIDLIPLERFRQMIANEFYIQLKKGMAGLLTTLSFFNSQSITED